MKEVSLVEMDRVKYKQIVVIILLLVLTITFFIFTGYTPEVNSRVDLNKNSHTIKIPKIIIPKKSMEFTITKDKEDTINFIGTFSNSEIPKEIAKLLNNERLKYQIKNNDTREDNNKTLFTIQKILTRLSDNYLNWSIVYKERKLLVSGETTNNSDKDSVERILDLSNLNSFIDIKVVKIEDNESDVISNLQSIVEVENSNENGLTEDEIEDILLNLKSLIPPEEEPVKELRKKIIKSRKRVVNRKRIKKKRKKVVKRPLKMKAKKKKVIKIKQVHHQHLVPKKAKKEKQKLPPMVISTPKPTPTIDILSLPFAKPINVEELKYLKTKKPLIEKETIYIKSDEEEKYKDIPWAKLEDVD